MVRFVTGSCEASKECLGFLDLFTKCTQHLRRFPFAGDPRLAADNTSGSHPKCRRSIFDNADVIARNRAEFDGRSFVVPYWFFDHVFIKVAGGSDPGVVIMRGVL